MPLLALSITSRVFIYQRAFISPEQSEIKRRDNLLTDNVVLLSDAIYLLFIRISTVQCTLYKLSNLYELKKNTCATVSLGFIYNIVFCILFSLVVVSYNKNTSSARNVSTSTLLANHRVW